MTVSLEMSDPDASRPFIEAANPTHPSLLDPTHQLDALLGVVNIPNVIWIDESGTIVRPPEPGWPPGDGYPDWLRSYLDDRDAAVEAKAAAIEHDDPELAARLRGGQDHASYPDAIRDWARKGADSVFAMTPDEVIGASTGRGLDASEGAAHFELANRLWTAGDRDAAIVHFNHAHRLQPDNWTYKRQAWSLLGRERVGGKYGQFVQAPVSGEEGDWPFASDFTSDVLTTELGGYYPSTL